MALLFWDSFDHYTTELDKWTTEEIGSFGSCTIGAVGRNGTNGLDLKHGNNGTRVRRALSATPDTLTQGVAVMVKTALPVSWAAVMTWKDGATIQLELRLENDGTLSVWRNGSVEIASSAPAAIPLVNVYNYVEMQGFIDDAAGTVEVRVNGVAVIDDTGLDTDQTGNGQVTQIELGGLSGNQLEMDFDDLYVLDDSGATCNDFLGDIRVCALLPDGAGTHADWTPSAGANWQCVDENPPNDDTDYNASATATDRDTFTFDDLPVAIAGTIHAACAVIDSRKDDAGTRTLQPSVRVGGTDYDGDSVNIPDTYAFHTLYAWEQNPDIAAAWTVATINAIESGYELVA